MHAPIPFSFVPDLHSWADRKTYREALCAMRYSLPPESQQEVVESCGSILFSAGFCAANLGTRSRQYIIWL
jgi:hypothetical protein